MQGTITENQSLVLIVDDDPFFRMQLRLFLETEGYLIAEAQNGREALTIFNQLHPDIVLLDAIMPDLDGFECCTQLQCLGSSQYTPVLMITGLEDQASVDRGFEVGASDYVTKPIHWAVLRQRVRRLIQQSQLQQKLEATNKKLQTANKELHRLVAIDDLTQVANRRKFHEYLDLKWRLMSQKQLPLSLIMCDIDFFKSYNDTYGHRAGDRCLQQVACAIKESVKAPANLVARYGGEEFAVILPNTNAHEAADIALTICYTVRKLSIPHSNSRVSTRVTISAGVATEMPQANGDGEGLIAEADRALYAAKIGGRDRVHTALSGAVYCIGHLDNNFSWIKH
ncbi:hypothetical protein NUACC21_18720 [Scytonema sp. NUACC21]